MEKNLRLDGETDEQFRGRVKTAAAFARKLIEAALANYCIQDYIADPDLPYTQESERKNPTVRIEYEQAFAICGIGEGLRATSRKHWGNGPVITPLQRDDYVDPARIIYVFRENSIYNRRFLQRQKLKELLGKNLRNLVGQAKRNRHGWELFREQSLTAEIEREIAERLGLTAKDFWRVARGKVLYTKLPLPKRQLLLDLDE